MHILIELYAPLQIGALFQLNTFTYLVITITSECVYQYSDTNMCIGGDLAHSVDGKL